jgi:Spy/CpxP family protein refolding chaperone
MTRYRSISLVCLTMLAASAVFAQAPAPTSPTPPTPPTPAVAPAAPRTVHVYTSSRVDVDRIQMKQDIDRNVDRGPSGYFGIVPSGTWWKNPDTIIALNLSVDQQKRMDDIFRQNRIALIDLKASLEKEQINLEPLLNANPVESTKALVEISKIADLRAGLEKANAKMLLGLRSILTADQWTKLQDLQYTRRKGPDGDSRGNGDTRGKGPGRGPGAQAGPGVPPPPPDTN